jgi:transcriptional regulator with XRE-family HTH domain
MRKKLPFLVKLGVTIRYHREQQALSQEDLADASGLHRTYIGGVERGERNISIASLLKIAIALKIDCTTLVKDISPIKKRTKP